MKLRLIITLFAIPCFIATGCKSKQAMAENGDNNTEVAQEPETPLITVDKSFVTPKENDAFTVKALRVSGDILEIDITYSGGCEEHDFELVFNGMYKKSLPPKADFFLKHDANGDACRKLEERTLKFDITEARYDAGGNTELIVSINNTDDKVSYTW